MSPRRFWSVLCAVFVVTVALVEGPPASVASASRMAATTSDALPCPAGELVVVRGSGETKSTKDHDGYGQMWTVVTGVSRGLPGVTVPRTEIDYPAVSVGYGGWNHYRANYDKSERQGVDNFDKWFASFKKSGCGSVTKLYLVGYSQGAQVVGDAYLEHFGPTDRTKVAAITLLGDPRFKGSQGAPVDVGSYSKRDNGIYGHARSWSTSDATKTRSFCAQGDPVCNATAGNIEGCLAHGNRCVHSHYATLQYHGKTYMQLVADWIIDRWHASSSPQIITKSLPRATVGSAYVATLATANHRPGTWSWQGGYSPPSWLILNSGTGQLTGTPSASDIGNSRIAVQFTDAIGQTTNRSIPLTVSATAGGGTSITFDQSSPTELTGNEISAISCPTTSFCLGVGYFGAVLTDDSGHWAREPALTSMVAPSVWCSSSTWCMAVGDANGGAVASVFNGAQWSPQVTIDPSREVTSLSCTSRTFCVAVGSGGRFTRYNGSTWTAPASAIGGGSSSSVTCTSTSFCLLTDGNQSARWNGSRWTTAATVPPGVSISTVSCASTNFCVGVGFTSAAPYSASSSVFNGSSWSAPIAVPSAGVFGDMMQSLENVVCRSSTFCMATDWNGAAFRFDGKRWHSSGQMAPTQPSPQVGWVVSCPTSAWCVSSGTAGYYEPIAAEWNGTSWGPAMDLASLMTHVSCATATFCIAIGYDGNMQGAVADMSAFNGTTWTTPQVVKGAEYLSAVACPTSTFCMVVGATTTGSGIWFKYSNGHRGAVAGFPPGGTGAPISLSCVSANFCIAVYPTGGAYRWDGTNWSAPATVEPSSAFDSYYGGLTVVSCASSSFCMAADAYGRVTEYADGAWGPTTQIPGLVDVNGLDCVTSSACLAVGTANRHTSNSVAVDFNGSTWKSLTPPPSQNSPYYATVDCVSTSFCAISGGSEINILKKGIWLTSTTTVPSNFKNDVSCPTESFCVALNWDNGLVWTG